MSLTHLWAAWIGILAGMLAGAALGLRFHEPGWAGGYGSWRRRLLRLGHISLFGLAFLNLAFALTADRMGWRADTTPGAAPASGLFLAGAALMPLVCALAAWRPGLRVLFPLPVLCLLAAGALTALALALPPGPVAAVPGGAP